MSSAVSRQRYKYSIRRHEPSATSHQLSKRVRPSLSWAELSSNSFNWTCAPCFQLLSSSLRITFYVEPFSHSRLLCFLLKGEGEREGDGRDPPVGRITISLYRFIQLIVWEPPPAVNFYDQSSKKAKFSFFFFNFHFQLNKRFHFLIAMYTFSLFYNWNLVQILQFINFIFPFSSAKRGSDRNQGSSLRQSSSLQVLATGARRRSGCWGPSFFCFYSRTHSRTHTHTHTRKGCVYNYQTRHFVTRSASTVKDLRLEDGWMNGKRRQCSKTMQHTQ